MNLQAVEMKLTEQRNFVLWWDGQEKAQGQRSDKPRFRSETKLLAGKDGLPDRLTIHRWRTRLVDESRFAETLKAAQERCLVICEAHSGNGAHVGQNTGEYEWYTP